MQMPITLQDLFYTTGTIAFVLVSVLMIVLFIYIYRISTKINHTIDAGNQIVNQLSRSRYSLQISVIKSLLALFGGERNHE